MTNQQSTSEMNFTKLDTSVIIEAIITAKNKITGDTLHITSPIKKHQTLSFANNIGDVTLAIARNKESETTEAYRVSCQAKLAQDWILFEVGLNFKFPTLTYDAIIPSGWGRKITDFPLDFHYIGTYPCWSCNSQLMILQGQHNGVSVSARDKNLELKYLQLSQTDRTTKTAVPFYCLEITRIPELHGDTWKIEGDCDILLTTHTGDWGIAAKKYRAEQNKMRPQLAEKEQHPCVKDDPFWLTYNCFAYPKHTMPQTIAAIKALEGPTFMHVYNWSDYPFDTHYPEMYKDRAGLKSELKQLKDAGAKCHPYLNGRLWDTTVASYETTGKDMAVQDYTGKVETEIYDYSSNIDLAVNCPSQEKHHDIIAEASLGFLERNQVRDGIYLDQVGAAPGLRCYAKNHNHKPGGAKSWNNGQIKMIETLSDKIACEDDPQPFLTTENPSEPMVDLMHGYLYYCGRPHEDKGDSIPLWQNIYGDITHNFADNFGKYDLSESNLNDNIERLIYRLGRQAIFGNAIGWIAPNLTIGDYSPVGTFMNNARNARLPFLDHFHKGNTVDLYFDSKGDKGILTTAWRYNSESVFMAINIKPHETQLTDPNGQQITLQAFESICKIIN